MSRPFPYIATVLTVMGCLVLLALGFWQVERLSWKEALLSDLEQLYTQAAPPLYTYDDIVALAQESGRYDFARGTLKGRFIHEQEILLTPRTHEGRPGAHLYTPLRLAGGGAVLINRGFLPLDKTELQTRKETHKTGSVTITGMLRPPVRAGLFVPDNEPAANVWYRVDLAAIKAAMGLEDLAPLVLYAEKETPAAPLLNREALRWNPPNNHRGYALFWFSMVPVLLIIYYLRFWHYQKERKEERKEEKAN